MPKSKYVRLTVGDEVLDLGPVSELPLFLNYSLEDRENFQQKNPSKALSVVVPATLNNDKTANTFHNPAVEDLTTGQVYKNNRKGLIEVNGHELLVGKSFLVGAKHKGEPTSYEYNFYGDNGDWVIDLKEATLYDFLKDIKFVFTKAHIIDSWNYDGTNINMPYVFAPVRYGRPMDTYESNGVKTEDFSMSPEYMKPAVSKYWILYKALRSLGYKIKSDFMDLPYFRRQVMPWTWGNFLISDGTRLDAIDFLAKSTSEAYWLNISQTGFLNVNASNTNTNGAFNNNNVYHYNAGANGAMVWTYPAGNASLDFGRLSATFHLNTYIRAVATSNSDVELRAQWFKNGNRVIIPNTNDNGNGSELINLNAPSIGRREFEGDVNVWATFDVVPGDQIVCRIYAHTFTSSTGIARFHLSIDAFEIDYFRIPIGGTIDFSSYTTLKKIKFLDFFAGIADEFNLCIKTDNIEKVVYVEPEHAYSLNNNMAAVSGGYFNGKSLDWSEKQDFEDESEITLYSENERELYFQYKEDSNDGSYKIMKDRNQTIPGQGKYVFPDRFKAGKKEIENRFFSAVMHYDAVQWRGIVGTDFPQMVCIVPENISNTSRSEAEHTFLPKSCYYKGVVNDFGWMFDGQFYHNFPYMFAVNYKTGGENDPILSYSNELIGPDATQVVGKGLIRRFYLQRLEIMRNGQFYRTFFKLNNNDVANFLHREHIICRGQRWEVVEINKYSPIKEDSTEVYLRKWSPIRNV